MHIETLKFRQGRQAPVIITFYKRIAKGIPDPLGCLLPVDIALIVRSGLHQSQLMIRYRFVAIIREPFPANCRCADEQDANSHYQ